MKELGQLAYEACFPEYSDWPYLHTITTERWARVEATIRADEKAKHEDALRAAAERDDEYRLSLTECVKVIAAFYGIVPKDVWLEYGASEVWSRARAALGETK